MKVMDCSTLGTLIGMKAWVAQGFPILRKKFVPKVSIFLKRSAILAGMATVLAIARHEIVIAALLFVIVAALVVPTHDSSGFMEEMSL